MNTSTVSSKYQVVIPKEVRRKLQIKPGQRVWFEAERNGDVTIKTGSALDEFVGSIKGAWGGDATAYIRKQRDEWDAHQQKLDDLHK